MYRINVWLKGGGKVTVVCDIDEQYIRNLAYHLWHDNIGTTEIKRSFNDEFPVIINNKEIAAYQVETDYSPDKDYVHTGRKLETNKKYNDIDETFNRR